MIEILMKTTSSEPAEFVTSWGTMLDQTRTFAAGQRNGKQKKMIASKSFTLGIYPKNLWWQE